jgi:hypothetical protein
MKKLLPCLFVIGIVLVAQSCTKGILVPDRSARVMDITGSWYLSETMQSAGGSSWTYYRTGLEKGVFDFYGNGGARYEDDYNVMTGYWNLLQLTDGYYDRYGDYHYEVHQGFKMHVYDNSTNNSIDLYFDDIVTTGGNIIGTSYNGHTITRYVFSRF